MNANARPMADEDINAFRPVPVPPQPRRADGWRGLLLAALLLAAVAAVLAVLTLNGLVDEGVDVHVNGERWDHEPMSVLQVFIALAAVGVVLMMAFIAVPLIVVLAVLLVLGVVALGVGAVMLVLLLVAGVALSPLLLLGALLWWAVRPRRRPSTTVAG